MTTPAKGCSSSSKPTILFKSVIWLRSSLLIFSVTSLSATDVSEQAFTSNKRHRAPQLIHTVIEELFYLIVLVFIKLLSMVRMRQ